MVLLLDFILPGVLSVLVLIIMAGLYLLAISPKNNTLY